ncbi:hypothetical protein JHK86_043326 [Glycine max]|nr:hypothetical protein JHK86_043326 [Glycine max]
MLRISVPLQESPPSTTEELTLLLTPRTYYHQLRNVVGDAFRYAPCFRHGTLGHHSAIERRIARLGEVEGQQIRNTNLTSNRLVSEPSEPASASAVKSSKSVGVMTGYLLAGSIIEPRGLSGDFGVANAYVQGGMVGDLSYMKLEFIQSFLAGVAASDALTSALRLITKTTFENSKDVLCKGATKFIVRYS